MSLVSAPSAVALNALLTELSSLFGFSMAARDRKTFVALANDIDAFTDHVFVAEGMDARMDVVLREQVRGCVFKHLGRGWARRET